MSTPVSNTIYASRDAIRTQVVDFLQQYMELNEVDLTQSSFLSYIIDILTTLSSNLMFYQSNVYREFFLTQAQLPESIHNLSSFLGYSPKEAKYATANVLMKFWLPFSDNDTVFNIPKDFEFKTSDGTTFVTYYKTTVNVTDDEGNTTITISVEEDERIYDLNYIVNKDTEPYYFQFMLPVRQYKLTTVETGIDDDILPFQFSNKFIDVNGKVAEIDIYVKGEDDTSDYGTKYTQFNSLYLMSSSDYGYVLRVASGGRNVYFGNGIIGIQPEAGSKIFAFVKETLGQDGNVIAGSITQGERIYSQQNGQTTLVDYEVINPSPAFGGEDEEDLQEIRSNSIKSLVSLGRLVSEQDYQNFDVVIPDAPVKPNSIPVLKRSDLKINEIQLFTIFNFNNELVPSKNISYEIPSDMEFIPRNTVISIDGVDYITVFEMAIESINSSATYQYSMTSIDIVPTLIKSWSVSNTNLFNLTSTNLEVINNNDGTATFNLTYYSTEDDFNLCECRMRISSLNKEYDMTNVPGTEGGYFTYVFPDHLEIPAGDESFVFVVSNYYTPPAQITDPENPGQLIDNPNPDPRMEDLSEYSASLTYRKDLKSFMMSNTTIDVESNTTKVYDIPVILKSYYDSINVGDFELEVLQQFLATADLKNYRMLTDFINLKLCNTVGLSTNMLLNTPTTEPVIDLGLTSIPSDPVPEIGDKYIVSGNEGTPWNTNRDKIAICTGIEPVVWTFNEPKNSDIVYVTNKNSNYIFTEYGWIKPLYEIPLQLSIEVFKENDSSISETDLINSVKTSIIDYYSDLFGPKLALRRSKVIDIIHNTTGVSHCRLIKPESDIFFDYNIDDFSQQQLLEYTPEWIYFTEDDITIKIFTVDR